MGARLAAKWQSLHGAPGGGGREAPAPREGAGGWIATKAGGVGTTIVQLLLMVIVAGLLYASGEAVASGVLRFLRRLAGDRGELGIARGQGGPGRCPGGHRHSGGADGPRGGRTLPGRCPAGGPAVGRRLRPVHRADRPDPGGRACHHLAVLVGGGRPGDPPSRHLGRGPDARQRAPPGILIKKGADLPLVLILSGVIGGVIAFGVIGLFIGPVLLAVTWTLLAAWVGDIDGGPNPSNRRSTRETASCWN